MHRRLTILSAIGFLMMVGAGVCLLATGALFSTSPVVVAVQAAALALLVWARLTFGWRSYHATAEPTEGGLVTTGPYRFIRHPIYTAFTVFILAGALAHLSASAGALALLFVLAALGRMLAEERLLALRYPEYAAYAARTRRMVPFLF